MGPPPHPELIDLDHAATTPLCDEAAAAMAPFLSADGEGPPRHGNPSGAHRIARDAVRVLDAARESVATELGCEPGEVVFTSGGTEADVHAVSGGLPPAPGRVLCSAVEHPAVLATTLALGGSTVAVDRTGRVDLDALADALSESLVESADQAERVRLVSVMAANNELGTVGDLDAVAEVVRRGAPGALLHTDAVQAAAWCDPSMWAVADLVSVSAHKLGGPKGVGALVVRHGAPLRALLPGGGQERNRRAGTPNLAGIVGFAAALRARHAALAAGAGAEVAARRDRLADAVTAALPMVRPTVAADQPVERLPGHLHLLIPGARSDELIVLAEQEGVCASAASSCASGAVAPSHVLAAIGADDQGSAALRLTLGLGTTDDDVERAAAALVRAVRRATEQAA